MIRVIISKLEKILLKNYPYFMTQENIKLKTLEMTFEGPEEYRDDVNQIVASFYKVQ